MRSRELDVGVSVCCDFVVLLLLSVVKHNALWFVIQRYLRNFLCLVFGFPQSSGMSLTNTEHVFLSLD